MMEIVNEAPKISENTWPQIFLEALTRPAGLIVMSGNRFAKLPTVEAAIQLRRPADSIIFISRIDDEDRHQDLDDADVVIYDGPADPQSMVALLGLCEEGRLVVQLVAAPSIVSSIHKIFSAFTDSGRAHFLWRFADQIHLFINQTLVSDLNSNDLNVHEIVLATPDLKKSLMGAAVIDVETALQENQEGYGIISFNQALLKLLVRRRIDIKTAFGVTRDPENLDQLLKRVGV